MNEINPIYLKSYLLNTANYAKIEIKLEIWQSNTGVVSQERRHSNFIGEVDLQIEALKKLSNQVSAVSFKLGNPKDATKDRALHRRNAEVNFRFEDIE